MRGKQSWDKLLDRVADSEKGTTATIRVTKIDNDRTKLLKEVLNCAAKATMGTRRPPETTSGGAHPFQGLDTVEDVHKVHERYESISGTPARSLSKPAPEQESVTPGPSSMLDGDSVLSVAAGIDPTLKGVLAHVGQRLAGLHTCLENESEPSAGSKQAPQLRRDVVVVSRGGMSRLGELQRLEEAADQFIDQFIQFEPLDALDATFADDVDGTALAEAFPGRSDHNPALVGLTDYLLERPEEWRRTMQRVQSMPNFTVRQRPARQVAIETCPSALSVQTASSEAASGPPGSAQSAGRCGASRQQLRALRTATTPSGATLPGKPRARGRGSLQGPALFGDLQG